MLVYFLIDGFNQLNTTYCNKYLRRNVKFEGLVLVKTNRILATTVTGASIIVMMESNVLFN
jgi:hypothetical protein